MSTWGLTGHAKMITRKIHITGHAASVLYGKTTKPFDIYFLAPPVRTEFSRTELDEIYARHGRINPMARR